jgi:hypothetical protein
MIGKETVNVVTDRLVSASLELALALALEMALEMEEEVWRRAGERGVRVGTARDEEGDSMIMRRWAPGKPSRRGDTGGSGEDRLATRRRDGPGAGLRVGGCTEGAGADGAVEPDRRSDPRAGSRGEIGAKMAAETSRVIMRVGDEADGTGTVEESVTAGWTGSATGEERVDEKLGAKLMLERLETKALSAPTDSA